MVVGHEVHNKTRKERYQLRYSPILQNEIGMVSNLYLLPKVLATCQRHPVDWFGLD